MNNVWSDIKPTLYRRILGESDILENHKHNQLSRRKCCMKIIFWHRMQVIVRGSVSELLVCVEAYVNFDLNMSNNMIDKSKF